MQESRPAAVYAPCLGEEAYNDFVQKLGRQHLYVSDHSDETPDDLLLPPHERPQLLRRLLHLMGNTAVAFATDDLSTLGSTRPHALAVLGYLLEQRTPVLVDGIGSSDNDYRQRVGALPGSDLAALFEAKAHLEAGPQAWVETLRCRYPSQDQVLYLFMPDTSESTGPYSYGEACLLVEDLLSRRSNIGAHAIAHQLQAQGYINKLGRHVWYHQSVKAAARDGRAKLTALQRRGEAQGRQDETGSHGALNGHDMDRDEE